jgi:hypothetical protein
VRAGDLEALHALAGPPCGLCGTRSLDWGVDFLGRAWCLPCATVEDARRRERMVA